MNSPWHLRWKLKLEKRKSTEVKEEVKTFTCDGCKKDLPLAELSLSKGEKNYCSKCKETTEGKVPEPKDDEDTTVKKLTETLEVGKTYTGVELEDLGYDIDVDMTDEEGRLFIAYPPEDRGDKYSVIDAGNDNYRVLKVVESKTDESKKDLLSKLLDLD